MYAYYASSCFGLKWPKVLARSITTIQLTQMFANLALLLAMCCCCGVNNHISFWPTVAMYAVYAALFLDLYRQKYQGPPALKRGANPLDKTQAASAGRHCDGGLRKDGWPPNGVPLTHRVIVDTFTVRRLESFRVRHALDGCCTQQGLFASLGSSFCR
jgi:hypothetical protein